VKACRCVYLAALTRRSDHAPGSALPRLAALARLAPLALLLLLAAERGSEQGRRWAAPVVLRSLAARSASASGWAALGGHAGLNGPREERRASSLLPLSELSPTSRRSAALSSSPACAGLRCPAREERRDAVAAEPLARGCATRTCPPLQKERKPRGLHDRAACLVRRFAAPERRGFSRLGR